MRHHAIYVPADIWSLPLPCDERILIAQVLYSVQARGVCDASDAQLRDELQIGAGRLRTILKDAEAQGYLVRKTRTTAPPLWYKDPTPVSRRTLSPGDALADFVDQVRDHAMQGKAAANV